MLFGSSSSSSSNVQMNLWKHAGYNIHQNSCGSQAPPDPPRPGDRAKSHPHSSPHDPRRKNGRRSQTRRTTIFKVALPGDGK